MIYIKLKGGLGNQMFQYALGKKISTIYNTELVLDTSFYKHNNWKKIIKNILKITNKLFHGDRLSLAIKEIKQNKRQYDLKYFILDNKIKKVKKINLPTINEQTEFKFDSNIFNYGDNIKYEGYFNTEKYFLDIRNLILQDFKLKNIYKSKIPRKILKKINNSNSVSLHVRRGDYINTKAINDYHGLCDKEYYKQAVNTIKKMINNPVLFIFSDDIEWCKKNLNFSLETIFISNLKNYEDLTLMSECKHNIIANSTFSWWGAWLNTNSKKIVISPKNWLANKKIATSDLLPDNWIKI